MSNQIDVNGIQIQTLQEIIDDLETGFKKIYGDDINVDSNTPDGQLINIFALSKQDVLQLIVQDYNSKDPDTAIGIALDGLSALCGIYRKGGTYTELEVTVTTDRALNLNGLDTTNPFTVSDSDGNLFSLIASASLGLGANVLNFRAVNVGYIQVLAHTVTIAVSKVLGIVSVDNATIPYQYGANQETDAVLRVRRQASVALPAHGFLESLVGGLYTVVGLLEAKVHENNTGSTDSDSVPAHSIWVIVDGGTDADVANMIYKYRNAGCGMYGATSYNVTQVDGTQFTIVFDRANYVDLYLSLTIETLEPVTIDTTALKEALEDQYLLGIYDPADTTSIIALIKEINPNVIVVSAGVSLVAGGYTEYVYPLNKNDRLILTAANISITGGSSSSSSSSSCRSSSSSSSSCRSSSSSSRSSSSSSRSSSSSSSCRSSSSSSSSCSSSSSSSRSSSSSSSSLL